MAGPETSIVGRLKGWARSLRRGRRRLGGGVGAARVPARWLRAPVLPAGGKACVFVLLPRDGRVLPHSLDHARAWAAAGYGVVVVAVVDALDAPFDAAPLDFAAGVLLRENRGYDFGAWAAAIGRLGEATAGLRLLVIANDSVLGPSDRFAAMVARAEASPAGLVGLTDCTEYGPHLQSYTLFFHGAALRSPAFPRFWRGVRSGDRRYVIDNYEVTLSRRFARAGVMVETLFPVPLGRFDNPALGRWRALLDAGFPFLKVQLLRNNPRETALGGWRDAIGVAGFDVAVVDRQIAALRRPGEVPWEIDLERSILGRAG